MEKPGLGSWSVRTLATPSRFWNLVIPYFLGQWASYLLPFQHELCHSWAAANLLVWCLHSIPIFANCQLDNGLQCVFPLGNDWTCSLLRLFLQADGMLFSFPHSPSSAIPKLSTIYLHLPIVNFQVVMAELGKAWSKKRLLQGGVPLWATVNGSQ